MKPMMLPMTLGAVMLVLLAGLLAGCHARKAPESARQDGPAAVAASPAPVPGPERRILALGDSLFAGYGLLPEQAYPVRLEAALRARGINARVTNAGVSGDTTADGLGRLQFTLASQPRLPDLVLVSLGGNDLLRGLPPANAAANLGAILAELDKRKVPVLMMGMVAPPNMGRDYARAFDPIYPALARRYQTGLVPFFLAAVVDRPDLRLPDRIHPTPAGVEAMVSATEGKVVAALRDEVSLREEAGDGGPLHP